MALPILNPVSQVSAVVLTTGSSPIDVADNNSLPFGLYSNTTSGLYSQYFCSGAAEQVSYTYKKLGGDVLDIELTNNNVFASYEEAVLEYSYIVNIHQAKNALSDLLGAATGTFDHEGQLTSGSSLEGQDVNLKFPRFEFAYSRRVGYGVSTEIGFGGEVSIYSASFDAVNGTQDYDLQQIVSSSAALSSSVPYYGKVGNKRINVTKVYYKTPNAMWRFYGYYGGINTVGNLASYGQWADDSTFEIIPTWQNKSQAMAFEDAIWTRNSHYSFEIKNNRLRIYPDVIDAGPDKYWIDFFVDPEPWDTGDTDGRGGDTVTNGINNLNTLPYENLPYENINSIGKQWIRRFALSLSKETLGNIRSKFTSIPIPGDNITLDGPALLSQAQAEQEKLREELKTTLDELTYTKLMAEDASLMESVNTINKHIPLKVYVG
tara:strand:+ start:14421 stop:15719 length:1299 start_codon:yes stop_codon:yes gene_type:complete